MRRSPLPTATFGDVSVVYSPALAADAAILAPCDTGDYEVDCNASNFFLEMCTACTTEADCVALNHAQGFCHWSATAGACHYTGGGHTPQVNCSGWDAAGRRLGTISDHRHILLDNVLLHAGRAPVEPHGSYLGKLFRAMFGSNASDPGASFDIEATYFEADIAATARFPSGVSFIIAQYTSLFGTEAGRAVQRWCLKWRWPLLWTATPAVPFQRPTDVFPARLLDPVVLLGSGAGRNLTSIAESALTAWNASWKEASGSGGVNSSASWRVLAAAMPPQLAVEPMRARACATPAKCVGLQHGTRNCVCY